jgi:hypothetical protein
LKRGRNGPCFMGYEEEVKVMVEQKTKTEKKRRIRRGGEEEEEKRRRRRGGGGRRNSPPVAKGGLLTNPAINLKIQNPAKLSTNAVGICSIQNIASGTM